jgi:ATP-dependent Clp protease protease subunit
VDQTTIANGRIVKIIGDITEKLAQKVTEELFECQSEPKIPISLLISSDGGSLHAARKLCDLIAYVLVTPVHGIAFGKCNSAASLILAHCDKRIATPNAHFIIHSFSFLDETIKFKADVQKHVERMMKEGHANQQQMIRMYHDRLDLTKGEVKKLMARGDQHFDDYLGAEKAKKIGLVTKITRKPLNIFPEVS